MDRSEVAVIIPAHNERLTIGEVVAGVSPYGIPIVVDDASTDGTGEAARKQGAAVVTLRSNAGYDGALNAGFRRAHELGVHYAVTFDADGQHRADQIPAFLQQLVKGADVVFGIRPRPARIGERLFGWYARARFGVSDPLCGMKGYRMTVYSARGHFDSYESIGTELALFSVRKGLPFAQVRIPIEERTDTPRFGRLLRANWRLLRALILSFRA